MNRYQFPIPASCNSLSGWQAISIIECGEKLVPLNELSSRHRITVRPQYYIQGVSGTIPDCFARESIAKMLIAASQSLPSNLQLVIWDAWRPISVQRALFDQYLMDLRHKYPDMDEEGLIIKTSTFVSLPSNDSNNPSPHNTGGAVDLSIIKEDDGKYLEMGTDFDDFSPRANTRYFEDIFSENVVSANELIYLQNRRLLYFVMINAGFTNYPDEWWHYDYGDQFWAALSGEPAAIYGSCSPAN